MQGKTAAQLLDEARAGLSRLTGQEAQGAIDAGAVLIDIRSEVQRERDGVVPGARFIPRNVLEWRCDPTSPGHDPVVQRPPRRPIVMCNEGFQSSLAAAVLQQLGYPEATDLVGGFQAWRAAGLAVQPRRTGIATRALECHCGLVLEGSDDEQLFAQAREHFHLVHPEPELTDEQIHERIAADAHDRGPPGRPLCQRIQQCCDGRPPRCDSSA